MPRRVDDFPRKVKRALSARVGGRCSHPDCSAMTSGPKHNSSDAVTVGVAAHITAAQPGGVRYDPSLSHSQRQSAANGIWLCPTHARLIDVDDERFEVEILLKWKKDAEARAEREIGRPLSGPSAPSAPHALDFSLKQTFLARLSAPTSSANGCIGIGFYVLTIVNRSTRPITIKEILFRYRSGGRLHETDSHVVNTGVIRTRNDAVDTAMVMHGPARIMLMNWHNLRPLIAEYNTLGLGSVLSGSVYFVLDSRDWSIWRYAKELQLVVRDYWGEETTHAVELPRDQVWSPNELILVNTPFTRDNDGKIQFSDE